MEADEHRDMESGAAAPVVPLRGGEIPCRPRSGMSGRESGWVAAGPCGTAVNGLGKLVPTGAPRKPTLLVCGSNSRNQAVPPGRESLQLGAAAQMTLFRCVWLSVLLLLFTSVLHAGDAQVRELSLEACIRMALEQNLDAQISRTGPTIARYQLDLARTSYDLQWRSSANHSFSSSPGGVDAENRFFPGTETEADRFSTSLGGGLPTGLSYDIGSSLSNTRGTNPGGGFENTSGSVNLSLRQPLLRNAWIDSTRLSIRLRRKDVDISMLSLRQRIMQIVTRVELAYYDLILALERVRVQQGALAATERLLAANRRRVEVGLMAPLDEKQTESQVAVRRAGLRAAESSVTMQEYNLKNLLGSEIADWHDVSITPTAELDAEPRIIDLHESWGEGLNNRPELLQARLDLEKLGISLRYQRNQLFPQLDFVASIGRRGSSQEYSGVFSELDSGDSPSYSYGAVFSIPLGNRAARKRYRIAKQQREVELLGYKRLEQDIMIEIGVAVEQVKTIYDRVAITRRAREFAAVALDAEERKLEAGKSTSFFVLQLQRELTEARSAEVQALADYNKALARLAQSEGNTLERHDLELGAAEAAHSRERR